MICTADPLSRKACLTLLLVSVAFVDPVHSYSTRLYHAHLPARRPNIHVGSQSDHHCRSTRLFMSTQEDPPPEDETKEPNYYEVLGASPDESRSELKKKYITLARLSHPDAQIGGSNSDENVDFQTVTEAWRTLGNPKYRKRYDRYLKAKQWGEAAQRLTNERLEQVAPMASSFMDNLAVPFLRKTSATVGKAIKVVKAVTKEETETPTTSRASIPIDQPLTNGDSELPIDSDSQAWISEVETTSKPSNAIPNQPATNGASYRSTTSVEEKYSTNGIAENAPVESRNANTPSQRLMDKETLELEQEVKSQEEKAQSLNQEYNFIKEKRLFASLQSPEYSLTSNEAEEVLDKLDDSNTLNFQKKASAKTSASIRKDIDALRSTEAQFTEKLESYTELDREWNQWLTKQESARTTLRQNKQREEEARKALDTAKEDVTNSNADVIAVSNKLKGVEQEVRKSAQEMDKVSTSLSRKQEKVQRALKRKTELIKGGIAVEYITSEEVKQLRQRESQLLGESQQIATMVAKLQSRADQLKKRAEQLEKLKEN